MLTVNDFKNALSTTNLGFVDICNGKLSAHNTHKTLKYLNVAKSNPARNQEVREALVNALVRDASGCRAYWDVLARELLGSNANKTLTRTEVKRLIDRHVTLKPSLTRMREPFGVQAEILFEKEAKRKSGEADVLLKFAAYDATDVSVLTSNGLRAALVARLGKLDASEEVVEQSMETLETAETAMTDVYALRGRDLLDEKGNVVPAGRDKIDKAIEALGNFEYLLKRTYNLSARRDLEQPPELRTALDYCASRLAELAEIKARIGERAGREMLQPERSLREVVANLAARLHGADDLARILTEKTTSLSDRIAALSSPDATKPDAKAVGEIRLELEHLAAYAEAAESGVTLTGADGKQSKIHLEQTMLAGLKLQIEELMSRVEDVMSEMETEPKQRFLDGARLILRDVFGERNIMAEYTRPLFDKLDEMLNACNAESNRFGENELMEFADEAKKQREALKKDIAEWVKSGRITQEAADQTKFPVILATPNAVRFAFHRINVLHAKVFSDDGTSVPSASAWKKFFDGKIGLGTLIGAELHGFTGDLVDERFDDRFLISQRKLGSGAVNTVSEISYAVDDGRGGTTHEVRVFKPEYTAMRGVLGLRAGSTGFSAKNNRAAYINRASFTAAKALGLEQVMPKISVGMHDGRLGFFMEKAEGQTPVNIGKTVLNNGVGQAIDKGMIPDVAKFGLAEKNRMKGTLARGLTDLMWADWLTGQMDRHANNYLVSFDADGTAHVKGVDNDVAFSATRTGLRKFLFYSEKLDALLKATACTTVDEYNAKFPDRPLRRVKEGVYELDAGDDPATIARVGERYGLNSIARPQVVSRKTYAALMALKGLDDEAFYGKALEMMGVGFTSQQVRATVSRLKEMVAYAEELGKIPGRVINDEDWTDPVKVDAILALKDTLPITNLPDPARTFIKASWDLFSRDWERALEKIGIIEGGKENGRSV